VAGEFAHGRGHSLGERIGAGQQREGVDTQHQKGDQLDQRLQCHRQHHAVVVLGGVDAPGAEQDRKQRQQRGHVERRIGQHRSTALMGGRRAGQHIDAHRHRLELQRQVWNHRNDGDEADQGSQTLGTTEARADEVGDRDGVLFVADQHDALEHPPGEHEQEDRSEVDRQKAPARAGRGTDRAIERPRRAVHRQGEAVDDRPQPGVLGIQRAAIADPGDREQQPDIDDRHDEQHPSRYHRSLSPPGVQRR